MLFFSQSSTLKSRNGSEWRAYCNLNDIGQFSSLLPRHTTYSHPESLDFVGLSLQGQRHICLQWRPHIGASLDTDTLLWMKMNQGFLVRHNLCSDFDKICGWDRKSCGAEVKRGHCKLISLLSLFPSGTFLHDGLHWVKYCTLGPWIIENQVWLSSSLNLWVKCPSH